MKIIIGAETTKQEGWISTNETDLDLLSEQSFSSYFKDSKADAMLAEHVWEHLTYEEGIFAAKNCFNYLKPGGYIRVAVPDGNLWDEDFLKLVGIGGPGPVDHPAYTHKILYDYKTLISVFESAGFEVNLLEYCDNRGIFNYKYWNAADGKIGRSLRYDTRNNVDKVGMASIIIDAFKPLRIFPSK